MNSDSAKELDRIERQFEEFSGQVEQMTFDQLNQAPKKEMEPVNPISQKDLANTKDLYLKPNRTVSSTEPFNEAFREDYNFAKEYVQFQAVNHEIIGECIEIWTKAFAGIPAEFWKVPVNKPLWGPRYLAEQIKRCYYHRLVMQPNVATGAEGYGQFYGSIAADSTIQRLDAMPVNSRKSVFMGATSF